MYCRKCGEKLQTSVYVKRKEPWGIVHIGVILLSVLLLITSFGLIMGGTGMRSFKDVMTDEDGYLMSKTQTTIRVDEENYTKAKEILAQIGLNYSQAVSVFNNMIVLNNGLPFEVKIPNKETKKTLLVHL